MTLFCEQQSKECLDSVNRMTIHAGDSQGLQSDANLSSLFDSPCSSISSIRMPDTHAMDPDVLIIIDDDDDDDIEINEHFTTHQADDDDWSSLRKVIRTLDLDTELIEIKPDVPSRICTAALSYVNLLDTHIIIVNHPLASSPECTKKRQLFISQPSLHFTLPMRTRVYHRSLSLLGFVLERPCPLTNGNRYLIVYDDFTANYHSQAELYLCLCQDFQRHMSNLDHVDLQAHYQHAFRYSHTAKQSDLVCGAVIRVRRFGAQFHLARIIDQDHSIIKLCFFERKSQKELWIHSRSTMIDSSQPVALFTGIAMRMSSSPSVALVDSQTMHRLTSDSDLSRLRKRKTNINAVNQGRKRLRDRSKLKPLPVDEPHSSLSSDETPLSASRANMLTAYYTNVLLPKFRALNSVPYIGHRCSKRCVLLAEENCRLEKLDNNPFLLPFEYQWSIVDGRPRGYRTPCRRTLYSLEDIDAYLYRTESKLSIKYFVDDLSTRFTPSTEKFDRRLVIIEDLSHGQECVRVPVYNDLNDDRPDSFTYVTDVRPFDSRIHAAFSDTNMTSCCNCTDNCNDRMNCACYRKTLDQAVLNDDPMVVEKQRSRYSTSHILKGIGYQRKRLLNPVSSGIYECNSKCPCHRQHCSNRLVQQGLFVQLQLFKDAKKGWGLRALHDLPRGTFICQYVGELLTSDQGHERAQTIDDKYQTSLDLVKQIRYDIGDQEDDNDDDDEPYVIDGSLYSNLGKYFNHSCEPNMYIQNVFIESHDLHFPNLALFTQTHVKSGQELTWHYNCELLPDRELKCFCGSKNCRGRLL